MNTNELSGRELDAVVSAEVLGLDIDKVHPENWPWWDEKEAQKGHQVRVVPPFSSSWEAASLVVEKINEWQSDITIEYDHGTWTARIPSLELTTCRVSLPEVVSRAALAWARGRKS